MKIVLARSYSDHQHHLIETVRNFADSCILIGNDNRNSVKYFDYLGDEKINVKSFKVPNPFNRIPYQYFRKSKARRSFEYALMLIDKGFLTPNPIAYIEYYGLGGLSNSYYISAQLQPSSTMRELLKLHNFPGKEILLKGYVSLIYALHEQGIEFIDNSSGNILVVSDNGSYRYYMVDLNRMRFPKKMSIERRLANFSRFTSDMSVLEIISSEYARLSGLPAENCYSILLRYQRRQESRYQFRRKIKHQQQQLLGWF